VIWDPTKPDGQPRRSLDTTRARQFGFQATTDFDDGLQRTIAWWHERRGAACSPCEAAVLS
jgi:GDP-L-fucose synthase